MAKDEIDEFLDSKPSDDIDAFLDEAPNIDKVKATEDLAKTKEKKAGIPQGNSRATGLGWAAPGLGPAGFILDYLLRNKAPQVSEAVQSAAEGGLSTLTAGMSEAAAAKAGVPLNDPESPRFRQPAAFSAGEIGAAALPSANLGRGKTAFDIIGRGAGTGAIYGGLGGASEKIVRDPNREILDALLASKGEAALGAAIGGGLPAAAGATSQIPKISGKLRSSAMQDILSVLSPGGSKDSLAAERIAPRIAEAPLKETFAFTRKGVQEKAAGKAKEVGQKINESPDIEGATSVKDVLASLKSAKNDAMVSGKVIDPDSIRHIEEVEALIKQFGDDISNAELQKIKRNFDKKVYGKKGAVPNLSEGELLDLKKGVSDDIRGILADADPDLAKLNKQYNLHETINQLMKKSETRMAGKPGLLRNLAGGAAATTAGTAPSAGLKFIIVRGVYDVIKSPGWKLVSAKLKNKLADALTSGKETEVQQSLNLIKQSSEKMIPRSSSAKSATPVDLGDEAGINRLILERQLKNMSEEAQARPSVRTPEQRQRTQDILNQFQREEILKNAATPKSLRVPIGKGLQRLGMEEEQLMNPNEVIRQLQIARARQELLDQMALESSR